MSKGNEPGKGEPVLRATGLSLRRAGAELTFPEVTLERGEFLALLGRSGSGKTTLLHLLAGLLVPRGGQLWLAGRELTGLPESERDRWRARHVGYLFQELHLLPWVTTLENVLLPAFFAGYRGAAIEEGAVSLLRRLGLGGALGRAPSELSLGERQRVALARALVCSPSLVLADEPTASLDDELGGAALELLLESCHQAEAALLLVTHDRRVVDRFPRSLRLGAGS
jgi:putative ABC transport system ATP-binding protein